MKEKIIIRGKKPSIVMEERNINTRSMTYQNCTSVILCTIKFDRVQTLHESIPQMTILDRSNPQVSFPSLFFIILHFKYLSSHYQKKKPSLHVHSTIGQAANND